MKAKIVESVIGVLSFNEENRLLFSELFPKKAETIAERLNDLSKGVVTEELRKLLSRLREEDYESVALTNRKLAETLRLEGFNVSVESILEIEDLDRRIEEVAVNSGFCDTPEELQKWKRLVSMELAKIRVHEAVEERDQLILQVIQTIDDVDKTVNLFIGRLREWYGLHFPELSGLVEKHETYARLVSDLGDRENYTEETLTKMGIPEKRVKLIVEAAQRSIGAELNEEDLAQIRGFSHRILDLYKTRRTLEGYVDLMMDRVAPNVRGLVGSLLGARLIALAGGLERLAKLPASTIQVLGAEKALFRSLKTGTRPPKHGVIFQHNLIHDAKRWLRGKIARAIAGKVAIAARVDAFGGKRMEKSLLEDLERKVKEIKEKYTHPPPVKVKRKPSRRKGLRRRRR